MDRPAHPRPQTFFPTAITMFRQCPERYYLQYIVKRKRPQPFSRPMVTGGATHRLLARIVPGFMRTGALPENLHQRALTEISTSEYPEDEKGLADCDAADVVDWTMTALEMLPAAASPLLNEKRLLARLGRTDVTIGAQVDLVVKRADGTVEHIDFKTGKVRDHTVQALMTRAVVGRRFKDAPRILSSTLFLQHRQRQTVEFDADECRRDWQSIVANIREIRSMAGFPPNPGPLCNYCPYQLRDCTHWTQECGDR